MATETRETHSSNVQPIPSMTGTVEYSKNMAAKSLNTMANSSKFVWHAWLGTAVTGQETATSFAQDMAKKGEQVEERARKRINERINEAKSKSVQLRDKAKARIDVLEDRVGSSMSRSLHFMGVPTRSDVDRLALLMADMSESLDELTAMKEQRQKEQQQSKAKRPSTSS
ncbi:MAG: phasin family protein [Cellvibrionaceae bacterium]